MTLSNSGNDPKIRNLLFDWAGLGCTLVPEWESEEWVKSGQYRFNRVGPAGLIGQWSELDQKVEGLNAGTGRARERGRERRHYWGPVDFHQSYVATTARGRSLNRQSERRLSR